MRKFAMLFGLLIVAAACSKVPTEPAIFPSGGAALDGGTLAGSGNKAETDSTATNTMSAAADSTGRGGFLGGAGN